MKELTKKSFLLLFIFAGFLPYCSRVPVIDENSQKKQAAITVMSGNNQIGQGGEQMANPIVIRITGSEQQPLANIVVRFHIVEGQGRIIGESTARTNGEGLAEVRWEIGSSYNGIEVSIIDEEYEAIYCYVFAEGENPRGIHKTRTIASLEKLEFNLYTITFYGDYSDVLEAVNRRYINSPSASTLSIENNQQCSLFSALGNSANYYFGRSYDNPTGWNCITFLGRYNPPDGYASLALSRTRDYGFELYSDFEKLPFSEKTPLFEAAFFTPDGINEYGVVAGCAGVRSLQFEPDPGKKSIWITLFVREILDHARNVDEAVEIAKQYNIFDAHSTILGTHFLIADFSGRSVVLELYDGVLQVIPNPEPWQVATNSPIYNVPLSQRRDECWRYPIIYDSLELARGNISWEEGMNILEQIIFYPPGTQWSSLYDLTNRKMILALDCNFEKLFHFSFFDEIQ